MQFQAVLSNQHHPESGVVTVPFPIPRAEYDNTIALLGPLEIGDAVRRDCRIDEVSGGFPVLKQLERINVNLDELDYLAKRLDSFDDYEKTAFQGMASRLDLHGVDEFINLTFCCQEVTVVTDFNNLESLGRRHYLTLGGGASMEEMQGRDFRSVALELLDGEVGRVTPYGVVYDNGFEMSQLYDGHSFPQYRYLQINEYYDFEELAPLLSGDAGLYELNALTHQLAELDEQQQISFKGLIQMEVNKKQGLIPTSRLIDLAYSVDCCLVADALNDAQLGRFYAENGFVPEVEHLPDKVFELLDFEKIGREARIGEGGVFTEKGYVVQHTELNEAFFALDLTPHQPDYQILLESEDGSMLKLPQAKLPDTTLCRCLDCRIPQLMGSIEASGSIAAVNEFAGRLSGMTDREMLRYKAALAATECDSLQSAAALLDNLDHYMLDTKISSPEDAAISELNFIDGDNDVERLQQYMNLPAYGRDLLEHDNAIITPYGRMDRDDSQPMTAIFQKPAQDGMEML